MTTIVFAIYSMFHQVFGLVLLPFRSWSPLWPLVLISLITSLIMLWIFGRVSNQAQIREVKNRIRGDLLAVRLYQHDIQVVLQVQAGIFRRTLRYLRLALFPTLVLIVPVFLILVQLNLYFSQSPLSPGQQVVLKVDFQTVSAARNIALECPPGLSVETLPVRYDGGRRVAWRIRAVDEGTHQVVLRSGEEKISKEIVVGHGWSAVSRLRSNRLGEVLLYAGEQPLSSQSSIERIEVLYSGLPLRLMGWNLHWLVVFFVLSVAFSFLFKNAAGVEL